MKCKECGETAEKRYGALATPLCERCKDLENKYLFDRIIIDEKGIRVEPPFKEENGFETFKDYINILFLGKVRKDVWQGCKEMKNVQDYTWLGMARALEYFHIAKKNPIKKSQNGIGIIPYIYDDAQKFYEHNNRKNLEKAQKFYENQQKIKNHKEEELIFTKKKKDKKDKIDLGSL